MTNLFVYNVIDNLFKTVFVLDFIRNGMAQPRAAHDGLSNILASVGLRRTSKTKSFSLGDGWVDGGLDSLQASDY